MIADRRPTWGPRKLRSKFDPLAVARTIEVGETRNGRARIVAGAFRGDGQRPPLEGYGFVPAEGPAWRDGGDSFSPWVKP